ncbi:hypothetical protein GmarT_12250 [Gimesia maris]|uniref:Uncharacterized protein n=1 Tax=Gimesia maris TaxID=122 RepID=A0ABX5YIC6_9PLAN|nr:hypothetical protein GmarT_12250 [Gimesia maris]
MPFVKKDSHFAQKIYTDNSVHNQHAFRLQRSGS